MRSRASRPSERGEVCMHPAPFVAPAALLVLARSLRNSVRDLLHQRPRRCLKPMIKAHTEVDDLSQRNILLNSIRKKKERERQKTEAGQWRRGGIPAGRTSCSAALRSGAGGRTTGDPAAAAFCTQLPRRHSQHRDAAAAMHNRGRPTTASLRTPHRRSHEWCSKGIDVGLKSIPYC